MASQPLPAAAARAAPAGEGESGAAATTATLLRGVGKAACAGAWWTCVYARGGAVGARRRNSGSTAAEVAMAVQFLQQ